MPTTIQQVHLNRPGSAVRCPVTGQTVATFEEGFDSMMPQSPYLRCVIDWSDEVYVVDPWAVPHARDERQEKLVWALVDPEGEYDSRQDQIADVLNLMCPAGVVYVVPQSPSRKLGSTQAYFLFDPRPLDEVANWMKYVRMIPLGEYEEELMAGDDK